MANIIVPEARRLREKATQIEKSSNDAVRGLRERAERLERRLADVQSYCTVDAYREITVGDFLSELGAWGIEMSQQTLNNYVKSGWVKRNRIDTAPGGRGQTGYFFRKEIARAFARAVRG